MKLSYVSVSVLLLSLIGCATNSSNMRVGTDVSYLSLKDQREVIPTVKEFGVSPSGAMDLGKVDAARCHRNGFQTEPTENEVKIDLKAAAYARGADGIADIKIDRVSGLMQNCWYILNGEATAFSLPKK